MTTTSPTVETATDTLVSIRGLEKVYSGRNGSVQALSDIDLDVARGEFVSIVGPSGCGKTTLLKMLAGLEGATGGSLVIDGTEVSGPRDDVGIAFQGSVMLPWRRIIDNVLLPVELGHRPTKADRERAHHLLELVGLADFTRSYPSELSGGMQQRASICRALVHDPSLLLLDEPFGALDALTREHLNVQLNQLWEETGKTAFLITHSISEAVYLSQRVIVMSARPGRIVDIIDVPFGRRRSTDIMRDPQFGVIADRIRSYFSEDH